MAENQLFEKAECLCFKRPGPRNTDAVLECVKQRAEQLSIGKVVVATCSGKSGFRALELLGQERKVICVTHVTGFREPNFQEMEQSVREELQGKGAVVFTGQHAFGGVGRGIRNKLQTHQVDEIMAWTLRTFGQGVKVCLEIALMAADAGLVRTDEDIIAVGGTGSGLDAACVISPANSFNLFDARIRQVICKPF